MKGVTVLLKYSRYLSFNKTLIIFTSNIQRLTLQNKTLMHLMHQQLHVELQAQTFMFNLTKQLKLSNLHVMSSLL